MNRYALCSLSMLALLPACKLQTQGDGCTSMCSPATPGGLEFIGTSLVSVEPVWGGQPPVATAVGGTQDITIDDDSQPFALPFATDLTGDGISIASTHGSVVTIAGEHDASAVLRVFDPATNDTYDTKRLDGAAVDSAQLVGGSYIEDFEPASDEIIPDGATVVWSPGTHDIGVALLSNGLRVVDTSMQLAIAGGTQQSWDSLHVADMATGTTQVTITRGGLAPQQLDLIVVDRPDAIAAMQPIGAIQAATNQGVQVCFSATSEQRFVMGLSWWFQIDGEQQDADPWHPNCVDVTTTKTSGSVVVVAETDGQTTSAVVPIM